jgi:hypothetical protein
MRHISHGRAKQWIVAATGKLFLTVFLCLLPVAVRGQEPEVTQITIESAQGGLSTNPRMFSIQTRKGFVHLSGEEIDAKKAHALIVALRAPALNAPQATNLGVTAEWLRQNVKSFPSRSRAVEYAGAAPNQRELYDRTFCDLGIISDLLPEAFKFWRSDDYPRMKLTLELVGGGEWDAISTSYYPFMLPWRVSGQRKQRKTYNADISRALAALMPDGSLDRNRLSDQELKIELSNGVMQTITTRWDLLDVENRAPDGLAKLRRVYQVGAADIDSYRGKDFGFYDGEPPPYEENLQAQLKNPTLPSNVTEDVVLLYHHGVIEGAGSLAEHIAPFETLALSVPWLNEYFKTHPAQSLHIRFVHDRSFSEKAMENFRDDMNRLGKETLATEVAQVQDKAALVFLDYGSSWIILPDKRMILWRHYLPAGFLKWKASDFEFQRCVDYNANDGGCVGAVISADGILQR